MIIKLDSGKSRIDKDIEIAIKNRGLREEMKGWASTTQLDHDIEVAVKNRGLRDNMKSWDDEALREGGNIAAIPAVASTIPKTPSGTDAAASIASTIPKTPSGTDAAASIIPLWSRSYMRAAAIIIGILVMAVPSVYIPYPYEDVNQYISSSSYSSVLTRGSDLEDLLCETYTLLKSEQYDDAITKANEIQSKINSLSPQNIDYSVHQIRQHAEWYEALGYLAKGRVIDRIHAYVLLKNIVKDENHAHYKEAKEIFDTSF